VSIRRLPLEDILQYFEPVTKLSSTFFVVITIAITALKPSKNIETHLEATFYAPKNALG
jgi:hypothetical protein